MISFAFINKIGAIAKFRCGASWEHVLTHAIGEYTAKERSVPPMKIERDNLLEPYVLRNITKQDIPACVQLIRASFQTVADTFGFTVENAPRFTAFATTSERLLWQLCEERRPMYAYYEGDQPVGYYSLALLEDGTCELNNLCVHPKYRHKGIGEALVADAFCKAREFGCTRMNIGIVEENQVLRKWYEDLGFLHTGAKKFDFFPFTCGYMVKNL